MYQPDKLQAYLTYISENRCSAENTLKRDIFRYSLWLLGIPAILYGAFDRGLTAFSAPAVNVTTHVSHCLIALVLLFGWIAIGLAEDSPDLADLETAELFHPKALDPSLNCIAQQSYRLPYPYLCQIYHLLNVKHLEDVHRFSLGNLRVSQISCFHKTQSGGQIRFKTMLDSPFNVLRLWRDPSVEVDLTIHSPYQIELKVPAYRQKYIRVLFSVIPLNDEEHHLTIHMFSNLAWPRELLKAVLMLASSLTLLEDLPYLSHLTKRNYGRLFHRVNQTRRSSQMMQLFRRYVDLYNGPWSYQQLQLLD
jgi:hypothetical protein